MSRSAFLKPFISAMSNQPERLRCGDKRGLAFALVWRLLTPSSWAFSRIEGALAVAARPSDLREGFGANPCRKSGNVGLACASVLCACSEKLLQVNQQRCTV